MDHAKITRVVLSCMCVYGLNFIEAKITRNIFITLGFDLNVKLAKLHTIYHL
jgi:hypothetical protein